MKKIVLTFIYVAIAAFIHQANAQNTFPATGNVGIGTTTPGVDLEVQQTATSQGSMRLLSTKTGVNLVVGLALSDCNSCWGITRQSTSLYSRNNIGFYLDAGGLYNSTRSDLIFRSGYGNQVTYMTILGSNGNVGIGTNCIPSDGKLAVNGKIYATALQLKLTDGNDCFFPDYVFSPSYKLTPLADVEKYILANKHLEGVPTAAEVDENGINVVDLNVKMLEKIEELTLYMIQLQKQNEILKQENKTLSAESESIELKLEKLEQMMQSLINSK